MEDRCGSEAEQDVKRERQEAHNKQQHFVERGAPIAVDVPALGHRNPDCERGEANAETKSEPTGGRTCVGHHGALVMPDACRHAYVGVIHSRGTAIACLEKDPHKRAELSRNDES